jgi:predicted RNase H-like nuclease (RuvC/YqgF family)
MTPLTRYGLIGALVVAVCLGSINGVLTYRLNNANEANKKLSDANTELSKGIESRDETISALKGAADADRRATEEQLKIEQQKRAKADAENGKLRQALEHSDCSNQRLPDSALDILHGKT